MIQEKSGALNISQKLHEPTIAQELGLFDAT